MGIAGTSVALNYGYNWLTGTKLQGRTLQNTGDSNLDYTRVGMWLLGEGEMDGLIEMWDSVLGRLLFLGTGDAPDLIHFHPGCDAVIGSGTYPVSTGGDQGVDSFFQFLPSGIQQLHYNRWAYYALKVKLLINNAPNTDQANADNWTDLNPIGLWRGMRCRIFDTSGNLSGYAFTRNPAWHYVDVLLRRKLFREYNIDALNGPDDLPTAVRRRFDWSAIADSAANFGEVLASGFPRFCGDYSFSQKTTLQSCLQQIHACSRSFSRERAGTYSIVADKPRASVFTFTRENADSFNVSEADVHSAANLNIGKFRDLLCPAFATIASISCADHQEPVVTTEAPHSAAANDYIVIGKTGTRYDGYWQVDGVPTGDTVYTMTLKNKGSNYPVSVGSGGLIGFRFSRFHERSPQFQHKAHQLARGAVGAGIRRQRNKVSLETDFGNSTWDQVQRVSEYQRGTLLGPDVAPYVAPPRATLRAPLFAPDAAGTGAIVIQLEPGDRVTIDSTLNDAYAGDYELMPAQFDLTGSDPGQGTQRTPKAGAAQFTLRPYNAANYPDTSTTSEPGWPDVPVLPGNPGTGTEFPLADGTAVFFTGSAANGDTFEIPDGYNVNNMLVWASPQGFVEGDAHLHYITDCDAYHDRKLALIYNDGSGTTWAGDVNYCGVAWATRNSASISSIQGVQFVELTLLGGEKIVFGKGYVASSIQVPLPTGYVAAQTIALAFPKNATESGHPAHGFAAWIETTGVLHSRYQDGSGNIWGGYGSAFIVSFQNNLGTWRSHANGWFHCPFADGRILAIAGQSIRTTPPTIYSGGDLVQITGSTVPPLPNISSATIQCMPGPDGYDITDNDCHGVKECYVDGDLNVTCLFEDGEGHVWGGSTAVFSLLCDTPTGTIGGSAVPATTATWTGTGTSGSDGGTGGGGTGTGGGGGSDPGGGGGGGGGKGGVGEPVLPDEPPPGF